MPNNKNHIHINVKNTIKLDTKKSKSKRHKRTKTKAKTKKQLETLARYDNSRYNPNAQIYQTGGSIVLPPTNKPAYDMNPRGIGWSDPNEAKSTELTKKLLLEYDEIILPIKQNF